MTTLQKLEDKIKGLVPEIMEWNDRVLVSFEWYGNHTDESGSENFSNEPDESEIGIIFGDEILGESKGGNGQVCLNDLHKDNFKNGIYLSGVDEDGGIDVWEYLKVEIIGRPIQLHDILTAWEKTRDKKMPTGEAMQEIWGIYCEWDLSKNLKDQLPRTHEFLLEVLS